MSGFNIFSVRKNNTVSIFLLKSDGSPERVFTAYLKSGFRFNFSVETTNAFNNLKTSLFDTKGFAGTALMHAMRAANIPTAIDINKKAIFTGSKQVSFSIPCFLVLQSSYEYDIADELNSLMSVFLPERGDIISNFTDRLKSFTASKKAEAISNAAASGNPNSTGGVWDLAQKLLNGMLDYIGEVRELKNPKGLTEGSSLRLQLGNFIFDDVILTDVDINFPILLVEGGNPDHVEVTLNVTTARPATAGNDGMIKF